MLMEKYVIAQIEVISGDLIQWRAVSVPSGDSGSGFVTVKPIIAKILIKVLNVQPTVWITIFSTPDVQMSKVIQTKWYHQILHEFKARDNIFIITNHQLLINHQ